MFEQYSIVLVNLDQTIGSEIKKTRPCVIIYPRVIKKLGKVDIQTVIKKIIKEMLVD
jgi:mRNA-degrading endonuclease toxin of MazEF toxin-antitoxin module